MNAELQQLISDAEKRAPHDALIRDLLQQVKACASQEGLKPTGRAEQIPASIENVEQTFQWPDGVTPTD